MSLCFKSLYYGQKLLVIGYVVPLSSIKFLTEECDRVFIGVFLNLKENDSKGKHACICFNNETFLWVEHD